MGVTAVIAGAVITTAGTAYVQHKNEKAQDLAASRAERTATRERAALADKQTTADKQAEQRRRRLVQLAGADSVARQQAGASLGGPAVTGNATGGKVQLGL